MIYIKSIEIENFQSHKYSKLDFSENLNVIVGPSDNGKSAIIRALKWCLFNEPKGSEFIRFDSNYCRVTLTLSDGVKIIRERTKTKNSYRLIKNGEEFVFEGFGNDIPLEILEAHKIKKIKIDKDNDMCLNLSEQLEGPFLLSQPNSFKSKAIGKIVGLNIIDEAIKDINKDINLIQSDTKVIKDNLSEINKKIDSLNYVNDLELYIIEKEKILYKLQQKINLLDVIKKYNETIKQLNTEIIEMEKTVQELKFIENFDIKILEKKIYDFIKLNNINSSINLISSDILKQQEIIEKTDNIDTVNTYIKKLIDLIQKYGILYELKQKSFTLNNDIKLNEKIEVNTRNIPEIDKIVQKIEQVLIKYSQLNDKYNKYISCTMSISKGNEYMKKFDKLDRCIELIYFIDEKIYKFKNIIDYSENYNKMKKEISDISLDYKKCTAEISNLKDSYKSILKNINVCPMCGSEIDELSIDKILSIIEEE
ncbi:MAG: AAA family ATPase [Caloramator sp.]|nr:AAA family ATPase [Caloramator sp.]